MKSYNKEETAYKTIGEAAKELNLIDKRLASYKLIQLDIGKPNLNRLNPK